MWKMRAGILCGQLSSASARVRCQDDGDTRLPSCFLLPVLKPPTRLGRPEYADWFRTSYIHAMYVSINSSSVG